MRLESLTLQQFRNYHEEQLEFAPHLNLILGGNAAGKTNLLEAIYYLSQGRSSRTRLETEIINRDADFFRLEAAVCWSGRRSALEFRYHRNGQKVFFFDGAKQKRHQAMDIFTVVLFTPDDLRLVKDAPFYRRQYLDEVVSQVSPRYRSLLGRYRHLLGQRNNLLRSLRAGSGKVISLPEWDEQLVRSGSELIGARLEMLANLAPVARGSYSRMSPGDELLHLAYRSTVPLPDGKNTDMKVIQENFRDKLLKEREREKIWGYTIVGPHRDDLVLEISGVNARVFASQGQQRTVVLALKLAQLEFLRQQLGQPPVLLLDDVASELDPSRRQLLLEKTTSGMQTFVTATDPAVFNPVIVRQALLTYVSEGQVRPSPF